MHWPTPAAFLVVVLAAFLAVPATAAAATPPTLRSPANDAAPATEGGSVEFEWSGALQGDPDALDRSFFRLELLREADMPSGAQTAWPSDLLENFVLTEPGKATTSVTLGVPSAGGYRWRVCAWGVSDDQLANEIRQLPGGCSASRAFTSVAASAAKQPVGELKIENRTQVAGEVRRVFVERPGSAAPQSVAPAPVVPEEPVVETPPAVQEQVDEPLAPTRFSDVAQTRAQLGRGSALNGVGGRQALDADPAAKRTMDDRRGVVSRIIGGLGSDLPLVPIPFWTLLLPLACIPLLRLWRREALARFEWADGSIDGKGTVDDGMGELAPVLVASQVKVRSSTADGVAPAPATIPDAPGRRRHAA